MEWADGRWAGGSESGARRTRTGGSGLRVERTRAGRVIRLKVSGKVLDAMKFGDFFAPGRQRVVAGRESERAGVHSGDSACSLTRLTLSKLQDGRRQTRLDSPRAQCLRPDERAADFAIQGEERRLAVVYVLEVDPALPTVPALKPRPAVCRWPRSPRVAWRVAASMIKGVVGEIRRMATSIEGCVPLCQVLVSTPSWGRMIHGRGDGGWSHVALKAFVKSQLGAAGVRLPTFQQGLHQRKHTDRPERWK